LIDEVVVAAGRADFPGNEVRAGNIEHPTRRWFSVSATWPRDGGNRGRVGSTEKVFHLDSVAFTPWPQRACGTTQPSSPCNGLTGSVSLSVRLSASPQGVTNRDWREPFEVGAAVPRTGGCEILRWDAELAFRGAVVRRR
jgi:hypothetical protein